MAYERYDLESRRWIYDCTGGYCHLCHKKLCFTKYARFGARGAWEVDHSNARANGGSDYLRNLRAACIACNRSKQDGTTRTARARNGHTRAPFSRDRVRRERRENALAVGGLGAVVGGIVGGPIGIALGGFLGSQIGKNFTVK